MKREIVMVAFEWRGRRQDDVCVSRRFIDVWIYRDHELECVERTIECPPVRRREHRIAGESYERFHLTWTRRENLFSKSRNREFAAKLRQLAHAAVPARITAARRQRLRRSHGIKRRQRKHRATRAIEVSGNDVQHIDQPLTHATKLLRADADAAVTHR